jgi:carbonic anhydrase
VTSVRRWHLIAVAVLAACEQWKAPQRIGKLEDKVEELAADVAAMKGSGAARPKVAHGAEGSAAHGGSGEPAHGAGSDEGSGTAPAHEAPSEHTRSGGSGEPAAGSDEAPAAKVSEPAAAHEPAKSDQASKSEKRPEPDNSDKAPEADKPDKPEKPEKRALEQLNAAVANSLLAAKSHDGKPHWTYDGKTGPASWGVLDPAWNLCADGKEQSPIDIEPHASTATPIAFHYKPTAATVVDNGHTLQVNLAAGSSIEIDGRVFELLQFHFHTPSEHTIAGEHYPLEVHLVHQGPTGKLAVIGVLYDIGAESRPLAGLWPPLSRKVGVADKLPRPFDPTVLLPETRTVFRYGGSLTTPPCTEGVLWNVMRRTLSDGRRHLEQFGEHFSHNARDLQPRNDRKVQ